MIKVSFISKALITKYILIAIINFLHLVYEKNKSDITRNISMPLMKVILKNQK